MEGMHGGGMCGCPHHKVVPLLITVIGLSFLLQALNVIPASTAGIIWPVCLTLIGVMKLTSGMCSCCGMGMKK